MATQRDTRLADQIVLYMGLTSDLSLQALTTIARSSTLGPFIVRLANAAPGDMEPCLEGAVKELKTSKERLAAATKAKRRERKTNKDSRPSKRVKYNPSEQVIIAGPSEGQQNHAKAYVNSRKPKASSQINPDKTANTGSTESAEGSSKASEAISTIGGENGSDPPSSTTQRNLFYGTSSVFETDEVDSNTTAATGSTQNSEGSSETSEVISVIGGEIELDVLSTTTQGSLSCRASSVFEPSETSIPEMLEQIRSEELSDLADPTLATNGGLAYDPVHLSLADTDDNIPPARDITLASGYDKDHETEVGITNGTPTPETNGGLAHDPVNIPLDDSNNNISPARDITLTSGSDKDYEIEVGITNGTRAIVDPIRAYCLEEFKHVGTSRKEHRDFHVQEIMESCQYLDFETARLSLCRFLDDRSKKPGRSVEMPSSWNIKDAAAALDALQTIANSSLDIKIRHAFAQMQLYTLVQVKSRLTKDSPKYILNELAGNKAGAVSGFERRKFINKYYAEYSAGAKWDDMQDWFGGPGIIIVFVTAGIASSDVTQRWNVFQRQCLLYLSDKLHSTERLVTLLGQSALEDYCRQGFLAAEVVEKFREFNGYE